MKILLIDNYDSFTYMLGDYIKQTGATCVVMRNNEISIEAIEAIAPQALVISPGPGTPSTSGSLMEVLKRVTDKYPILGVCLGHQALGELYGAKLIRAEVPKHGKTDEVKHNGDQLFKGIPPSFLATRYHSLVLVQIPEELEVLAQTQSGEIMALKHRSKPLYGIQFHPESCMTEHGLTLISNFLNMVKHLG